MEFGSLGLGTPIPAASTQTGGANPAPTATLETNPQNVVTPAAQNDAAENDLRRDGAKQEAASAPTADVQPAAATDGPFSSRRTTLAFDSEQNRIFLEVVDTATQEVIERIPSDELVALIDDVIAPPGNAGPEDTDTPV